MLMHIYLKQVLKTEQFLPSDFCCPENAE